jgi:PAS domain S-box-containing protein
MQARRTADDYYQLVLESLNEAVYAVDVEGRIQFCNAAMGRLTGYAVSALLGRSSTDLYVPEAREVLIDRHLRAFRGESVPALLQATLVYHDGARLPVELSEASLTRGQQVIARLAVVRDVSARKHAEAALHESQERFRLLVEGVQDYAIYMLDPTGHVVSWNAGAERIKGYRAEEILGEHFSRFYTPEDIAQGLPRHGLAVAAREGRFEAEGWRVSHDGSRFWADVVITALYDTAGKLRGFAKVTRDFTERREAEQALEQAKIDLEHKVAERTAELQASLQEKEVLLKEIHHRVKNNLQVISSLLSLQSHAVDAPQMLALFQESQHRINSMALVHETLYQTGDLANFNLAQYIPTLSAQLMEAYGVDAHRIALGLDVEAVTLPLDMAVPCGLILNELLSNCFKHAFPGETAGDITVTLTQEADSVTLMVRDNGCGFPAHLDFRDTESLGLQLVCALTEQLRGSIMLERNRGTAFTLTFKVPVAQVGADAEA